MARHKLDLPGSGKGQVSSCCECGNGLPDSIKRGGFVGWLMNCQFLKIDSAAGS